LPRQYTFKTTRKTEWMEEVLGKVDSHDRSSFIREMLVLGMKTAGIIDDVYDKTYFNGKGATKVLPLPDKSEAKEPPKTHIEVTKVTPEIHIPQPKHIDEPLFEVKEVDLDSKLKGLDKLF
jgi:hypothetical protein